MIERKKFIEELKLRENIQGALKIILEKRRRGQRRVGKNEHKLRLVIQDLLKEGQSAVAAAARHDSTGINALEDLLKNSNVLFVIETGYKSLTTRAEDDPEEGQTAQRRSYENHILSAVKKSLAPEESRKSAGEDVEITEDIDIAISDKPEDDPDFIDVEEKEEVEVDEKEEFGLDGEDKTGRNRAFTDFTKIEKDILTAFDDLDNRADITLFEEYLIKNLALYFEKYEAELASDAEAPPEAAEAEANLGGAGDELGGDEEMPDAVTEVPEFELQEAAKYLNIEDVLNNLL